MCKLTYSWSPNTFFVCVCVCVQNYMIHTIKQAMMGI